LLLLPDRMSSIGTTTNVKFVEQPRIWRSTISSRWLKVAPTTSVISRRYARVVIAARGRGLRQKTNVISANQIGWLRLNTSDCVVTLLHSAFSCRQEASTVRTNPSSPLSLKRREALVSFGEITKYHATLHLKSLEINRYIGDVRLLPEADKKPVFWSLGNTMAVPHVSF
jgi:hypothetical protein